MFGYTAVVVFMNGNDLASLLSIIILGVFFGSDMLMAGGMIYLMKNYIVVNQEPVLGQYMLLNHNGQPMLVQAQPIMIPQGDLKPQIIMV